MGWILGLLEFLEFWTTPMGLTVGLWLSLYWCLQILGLNLLLSALLPAIVTLDLYFLLRQSDS